MDPIRSLALALAATVSASPLLAQCEPWSDSFASPLQGPSQAVYSLAVHDDGSGPALYVGGVFDPADGLGSNAVARWDGASWSAVGSPAGANDGVRALAVHDDGSGPALFAGGQFTTIGGVSAPHAARWNGAGWTALPAPGQGPNGDVWALCVFDDGGGPDLYAGGGFTTASGAALRIARWSGTAWQALGSGMLDGAVHALAVFDDGTGPALYAGGTFTAAGGVAAAGIARWSGSAWSALGAPGAGVIGSVRALAVHDDGSGPALYVGGLFHTAGGVAAANIARWDGVAWSALGAPGAGTNGAVEALLVHDDGSGSALYAGGSFATAGGVATKRVARWDGAGWSALGGGIQSTNAVVRCLAVYDPGTGPELVVGGEFQVAGGVAAVCVARWDGASWAPLHAPSGGMNDLVPTLAVYDSGSGPELYAGGMFWNAGGTYVDRIARRTPGGWSAVGNTGSATPCCIQASTVFDDGGGPALYVGGSFVGIGQSSAARVARWDGASWSPLGSGPGGQVYALTAHDDGSGPALYVAGAFSSAGGVPAARVARWNGAAWSALGPGITNNSVTSLASFDPGTGPELFAGGNFHTGAGGPGNRIARWDGAAWSAVGAGVGPAASFVLAMAVFDDGTGPALYAGGDFTTAGGSSALRIARWDGASWSPLGPPGSGMNGLVRTLLVHDDGAGPALYAAGDFDSADGFPTGRVARWDGTRWSPVFPAAEDVDDDVYALAFFDEDGDGEDELWLGGAFTTAGTAASSFVASRPVCGARIVAFCSGDGGAGTCPCGNAGAAGRGCDNSVGTGGALLTHAGTTVPDTLVLAHSGELASSLSIFLQGDLELASAVPFGDGLRCAGGELKRLYVASASAGTVSAPQPGDPSISARSAALGDPLSPGDVRVYQVYYRDPDAAFCPAPQGGTFNVGNALRVTW